MSGVPHAVYWLSHCIWDYARFIVAAVLVIVVIRIGKVITGTETGLSNDTNMLLVSKNMGCLHLFAFTAKRGMYQLHFYFNHFPMQRL